MQTIIELDDTFWNIRGSFKVGGILDVGTQCSLVRRKSGKYVFLDGYTLTGSALERVYEVTKGGKEVESILHVHPFHTLHVSAMHELFPHAKLYGTARHLQLFANLPWEDLRTEDPELHELFADDFEFSVPRGVDFISADENVHFSSVLVSHPTSKTLHVDDTLMYLRMPKPLRSLTPDVLRFHPTLGKVLEPRAGAAHEFRGWAHDLAKRAQGIENLCAAHSATLSKELNTGPPIAARIESALKKAERVLKAHDRRFA